MNKMFTDSTKNGGSCLYRREKLLFFLIIVLALHVLAELIVLRRSNTPARLEVEFGHESNCPTPNEPMNFSDFDNSIGMKNGCFIVPNIVHFIRFTGDPINYLHMICYLAAFKNQKPEKIYFHYDNNKTFSGKYWEILKVYPGFMDVVELKYLEMPREIFGQEINPGWAVYHGSDVARIRTLITYGGIFLDNDMYLVKSLDAFRRFEMTLGWDSVYSVLGTQNLIAHKDARFLKLWLESYRGAYKRDNWYYNAGDLPTKEILLKKPKLVHVVVRTFGNDMWVPQLYGQYWPDWKPYFYSIHILHRHIFSFLSKEKQKQLKLPETFNETNILNYDITMREMALDVYNPTNFTKT